MCRRWPEGTVPVKVRIAELRDASALGCYRVAEEDGVVVDEHPTPEGAGLD